MSKQTIFVDASALQLSGCMRRLVNTVVLGYKPKLNSIQMEWGTAFHKFRAHIRNHGIEKLQEAIFLAQDHLTNAQYYPAPKYKQYLEDTNYLVKACCDYALQFQKDNLTPVRDKDNSALIELKFAFPYYIDDQIELLLAGTVDEIAKFENGIHVILDCKTTGMYDVDDYLANYVLNGQLLFYLYAVKQYAQNFPDSVLNLVSEHELGLCVEGIFHKSKTETIFKRSTSWLVKDETLAEYSSLLETKLQRLIQAIKQYIWKGEIPLREGIINNACETKYRKCDFFSACAMPDKESYQAVIDYNFITKQYNPLEFQT